MPNIVILFTDDQGYQDLGCYGAEGFQTPNIDRMAENGVRFTQFYVSEAVCSASRSSLLTGCYASRLGIVGALTPTASVGLNPDETTIAEMLKPLGYTTAMFGKWHLGHHKKFMPNAQGFDEYLGLPYSNDMWPVNYDGTPSSESIKAHYPPLTLLHNTEIADTIATLEQQAQLTNIYTKAAEEFIAKNQNKPFFLYLPYSMPHVPIAASQQYKGKSARGLYGDVIMEIDGSVGRIIRALRDNGLEDNTLVIFTSDNGPWKNFGNHAGNTGALREGKGNMFEGGCRVPCVMQFPSHITKKGTCSQLAATVDILPTIASLTGASLPENAIDGLDLSPFLFGNRSESPRNEIIYFYEGGLTGVRRGDWKLVFPHRARLYEGTTPGNDGFPGPYNYQVVEKALYNLNTDISETTNLISQFPEKVKELEIMADSVRSILGDQFTGAIGSEIREIGRLAAGSGEKINHKALGKKISLKVKPHPKYQGGKNGLINGVLGSSDFNDGNWCGFEYHNLEAVIDLGSVQNIDSIASNYIQSQGNWIFLPRSVKYSISSDSIHYKVVYTQMLSTEKDESNGIKRIGSGKLYCTARYLKIEAENIGVCPEWHIGTGGRSWMFVDELVIY